MFEGYVAWWLKGDVLTPYILIGAVAALLLAVILVCIIIICICRRKRRQEKCKCSFNLLQPHETGSTIISEKIEKKKQFKKTQTATNVNR